MQNQDETPHGPLRRAPRYYIGETVARMRVTYPDTERHPNGALPGIRDKAARRVIRKAFLRRESKVEKGLRTARAMQAQAREVVGDEHYDRSRYARAKLAEKLYQKELAIHVPVFVPTKKQIRVMRTEARKAKRAGAKHASPIDNAIDAVLDKFGTEP